MNPALVPRFVDGAEAGSVILTASELAALHHDPPRRGTLVARRDGTTVELAALPIHVIADHPADLPGLTSWQAAAHESFLEGLIDADDHRRLLRRRRTEP